MDYSYTYGSSSGDQAAALFGGAFLCAYYIVLLVIAAIYLASLWKIFVKAGKPGWAAIVPIYNIITLLEIVGRPVWWIVLYIIPFANIYVAIQIPVDLAKSFGKTTGYALGLIFLSPIFYPMLAFGSAQYAGPIATMPPYYPTQPPAGGYYPPQPPQPYAQPIPPGYAPPAPPAYQPPPVYAPPAPPAYQPPPPPVYAPPAPPAYQPPPPPAYAPPAPAPAPAPQPPAAPPAE
jgi:hypothetical protein